MTLPQTDFYILAGPPGAGKTTLLQQLSTTVSVMPEYARRVLAFERKTGGRATGDQNPALFVQRMLETAIADNPFPGDEALDKTLHLYFLSERPTAPDFERMDAIKVDTESYRLIEAVCYLHTPDGFGRSKLAQRVEKLLGVNATARNWRTVHKVMELALE